MFYSSVVVALPPGFSNEINITRPGMFYPSVATDSFGNSHVVYSTGLQGDIFYQKLNISGSVVVSELQKTNTSGNDSRRPAVAVDGSDNLFVVWEEVPIVNDHDIFLRKLDNSGQNLSVDVQVSNAARESVDPAITVDSQGSAHIVWSDQRNFLNPFSQQYDLYYAKVLSNGTVAVSETALTSYLSGTAEGGKNPSIAVDSHDDLHVAFRKKEAASSLIVQYLKLNNSGGIIVPVLNASIGASGNSYSPSLRIDSNDLVHIAFVADDGTGSELWYVHLSNNGSNTGAPRRLTFNSSPSASPSLGIDVSDEIHISWIDDRTGFSEIFYTELDNFGNTIVDGTRLSFGNVSAQVPSLALDGRGPVVAWFDYRNNPGITAEIFYTRSIPFLTVTDFAVVYANQSDRLFRFGVRNIAGQNLSGIQWRLNTGEALINSTMNATLTINEKLMVFVWYSYVNAGNYTVYATGFNQNVSATNKLQVLV